MTLPPDDTLRLAGRIVHIATSQLRLAARVEPLDARALLLDSVRELFAMLPPLLAVREPGDKGVHLIALVRELVAEHATLARGCERELQLRAMHAEAERA
jgi:hypothetical protein